MTNEEMLKGVKFEKPVKVEVELTKGELMVLFNEHQKHARELSDIANWDDWSKEDAEQFRDLAMRRFKRSSILMNIAREMDDAPDVLVD